MIVRAVSRLIIAILAAVLFASCGGPGTPLGPPSAHDILSKPNHASLKDAHFLVTGTFASQGITVNLKGDGELVYQSPGAGRFKFQTLVAGQTVTFDEISIGGSDYTMTVPGNGKWVSKVSTSPLGPDSFRGASDFKYVGEENLPAGKSWHAKAKDKDGNPFDGWIRESDGYPLKYTLTQPSIALTLSFDTFNTGVKIAAPPASEVVHS